jgi:hypothetical protein
VVAVPAVELVVAATLLVRPDFGGVAALVLLAVFTGVVFRALVAGVDTGCGCFGSASGDSVGPRDLVRNALLAALAVVATGTSHPVRPSAAAAATVAGVTAVAWVGLVRR